MAPLPYIAVYRVKDQAIEILPFITARRTGYSKKLRRALGPLIQLADGDKKRL